MSSSDSGSGSGCLGLIAIMLLVGFVAGKILSPDWSDRRTVLQGMAGEMRSGNTQYGPVLQASCGTDVYTYYAAYGKVMRSVASESEWRNKGIRRRGGIDETEKLAALLFGGAVIEGGAVSSVREYSRGQQRSSQAARVVALAAVVGVGFYLGYDGEPDCTEAKDVYTDKEVWQMFARTRLPRQTSIPRQQRYSY